MFLSFADGRLQEIQGFTCAEGVEAPSHLWSKGYFFDQSGELRVDEQITDWLAKKMPVNDWTAVVPGMNGSFSFVVVRPSSNEIIVAQDRIGAYSIFYSTQGNNFCLSDDFWQVQRHVAAHEFDPIAAIQMVLLGYVAGPDTLLRAVKEFSQACIHTIQFQDTQAVISSKRYWQYSAPVRSGWRYADAVQETAEMLNRVFARYSAGIARQGWKISIPLSSGLDSRLILGMFHRLGHQLSTFSYGPTGNLESQLAGDLAEAVSAAHRFVPLDDPFQIGAALIRTLTRRNGMKVRFTSGIGAQFSLNGYSPDVVFMPGHPGNLPTGSALERGFNLINTKEKLNTHMIINRSLYVRSHVAYSLFPRYWNNDLLASSISPLIEYDPSDLLGSYLRWDYAIYLRGIILPEMRTYSEFGRWLLPYIDYELVDHFATLPPEYLSKRRIFNQVLLDRLYKDELQALADIPIAGRGQIVVPKAHWKDQLLSFIGPSPLGDLILKWAVQSKHKEWQHSSEIVPSQPEVIDAFDYWWYHHPAYKQQILAFFDEWDGLHGIVDVVGLLEQLSHPQPKKFLRYALPSLMTLCEFQKIVENQD